MTWNYRVIRHETGDVYEPYSFKVHEVYYHDDGSVAGWIDAEEVWGDSPEAVRAILAAMLKDAVTREPLRIEGDTLVPIDAGVV